MVIGKGADNWNRALYRAVEARHRAVIDLLLEKGANDWPFILVRELLARPDWIEYLMQRGHVPRETFRVHDGTDRGNGSFARIIREWEQRQMALQQCLYDTHFFPRDLVTLIAKF